MKIGKITKSVLLAAAMLTILLFLSSLLGYMVPGQNSFLFTVTWLPALLLAGVGYNFLARKYPQVLSDEALIEGGPRLTIGRGIIGVGVVGLWAALLVVLSSAFRLSDWQVLAIWVILSMSFLWVLNLLEERWMKQDTSF